MKKLILFSSFVVVALFVPHYGWAQQRQLHAPVITHAYAADRVPYKTTELKVYIEAEDADGDMNYVFVVVDEPGHGPYPPDRVLLESSAPKSS